MDVANVGDEVNRYMLPFRNEVVEKQRATDQKLQAIQSQLSGLADSLNKSQAQPVVPPPTAPAEEKPVGPKTVVGKIADKEAEFLAEHGGPLSSRLAKAADENLDSDSAAIRFKGFTQAKVAMLVFFVGVLLVLGLGVFVIHRINAKLLPKLQEMAARTPTTIDDRIVGRIQSVHDRIDDIEGRVRARVLGAAVTAAVPQAAPLVQAATLASEQAPASVVANPTST